VVGTFAEMPSDTNAIADLIASVLAVDHHCFFFNNRPADAKGMFTQRLYTFLVWRFTSAGLVS